MHLAAAHTGGEVGRVRNLLLGVLGQGLAVSGAEAAGLGGRVLGGRRPGPLELRTEEEEGRGGIGGWEGGGSWA